MRAPNLLVTILVAGLLAGLAASVFHTIFTEPVIDQAITLEEMRHGAGAQAEEPPVVPRDVQKIGLFVGWLALGWAFAGLVGGSYGVARRQGWVGPGWMAPVAIAVGGYLVFALLPGLKYPANPPGVGSSTTITIRQEMFVAVWLVGLVGALAAAIAARTVRASLPIKAAVALGVFTAWAAVVMVALPTNPDPITMPLDLVGQFRVYSLIGLTLFWAVLGLCFAWVATRTANIVPMQGAR